MSSARRRKPRAAAPAPGTTRSGNADAAPGAKAWLAWSPLVAAAVAFLVYAPSLAGGFLYDDGELILRNPSIRNLGNLTAVLRYEPSRPLLNLTWALNYALGGLAAWPYHLVNVLIHSANAALLFSLFEWIARRRHHPDPRRLALLGACLFAASPMAAETVAYVASRSSALATFFALGCLRVTVGVLSGGPRSRLAFSAVLFLLALATKEEAAAVPFILLLLDYFFVADQKLADLRRRGWIHGCFLSLLPLGLLARWAATGTWLPAQAVHPGTYLLTQWAAFPLYFFRVLVPLDPAFYRHHAPAAWPPDALTAVFSLLTLTMVLVAVRLRHRWPEWSFAAACLAVGLLPSSSVVALVEMVVDHRAYLGSFGVVLALATLVWRIGGARLGIVVILLFAARSIHYEWVLGDPVRAWEDAVRRAPGAGDAWCALGESYAAREDPRAEAAFQNATRLGPDNARYWANLALYYSERGRIAEAASALRTAAAKAPRDGAVRDFLGQMLERLGREDEALAEYEAAVAAEPGLAQPRISLAALLLKRGQAARARELLAAAAPLASSPEEEQSITDLMRRLP